MPYSRHIVVSHQKLISQAFLSPDTHTYQQARAPLSLPSRASCASSAIATANSPSHRATSESTVGVRYFCFCGTAVPPLPPPAPSSARAASAGAPGNAFSAPPLPLFLCCCCQPQSGRARARSLAVRLASRDGELSLFSACCRSGGCSRHAAPAPPPRARAA